MTGEREKLKVVSSKLKVERNSGEMWATKEKSGVLRAEAQFSRSVVMSELKLRPPGKETQGVTLHRAPTQPTARENHRTPAEAGATSPRDGFRRPSLREQTHERRSGLRGYLAACFLCRSVQTETAELGSTALSPPSMWRMMPSLSMTMLARKAHS
jgi:hypothetical protein